MEVPPRVKTGLKLYFGSVIIYTGVNYFIDCWRVYEKEAKPRPEGNRLYMEYTRSLCNRNLMGHFKSGIILPYTCMASLAPALVLVADAWARRGGIKGS